MNLDVFFKISQLLNVSIVELVALNYDLKPALSELVNFNKFDQNLISKFNQASKLCKKLGLHLAVSECKFVVNSPQGIFKLVDLKDPQKGKLGVGISKNKRDAVEAVDLYYKKTKDSKYSWDFAVLHGYPECCTKFGDYLCQNSKGDKKRDPNNFGFTNPAVESLKNSKNFAWQLNVFANSLLSYYPCHLACQESVTYVDKIISIFEKLKPDYAHRWKEILQEPTSLYWTCADKILLYGDFKGDFKNSEVKYNKSVPEITSKEFYQNNDSKFLNSLNNIYQKIKQGNRLIMRPKYFEVYKDKKRITKIKKDNQYVPVLVKPNK